MMRERQQKIVEHVSKVGIASYSELAQLFGVSPFTIRRDVEYLAHSRLLARIKGGAQRIETPSRFIEAQLPNRMQINLREKEQIAEYALSFIRSGDSVFLDGSSTILCLARALAGVNLNITVVTNSVLIALELSQASNIRIIGLGGVFDPETFSFVGFETGAQTDSFYIDKAFLSCTGFIANQGTFDNAAFNRAAKRLNAQRANKVFLLIDSGKFGRRGLNHILKTDEIDVLITDKHPSQDCLEALEKIGVDKQVAAK
ncbi:MAG: DeoR/GlpR transcriptional regulator [Candidatus Brocadiia bacterium]|nr:MAG: DeoR/GlpR transcriptional regulator [Candidatus Brocadiia bacterium]